MSHAPIVPRDPFRSHAGRGERPDAPDVQFVRQRALDEVNECRVGRPQLKVRVRTGLYLFKDEQKNSARLGNLWVSSGAQGWDWVRNR
jgi:hypothetical protein